MSYFSRNGQISSDIRNEKLVKTGTPSQTLSRCKSSFFWQTMNFKGKTMRIIYLKYHPGYVTSTSLDVSLHRYGSCIRLKFHMEPEKGVQISWLVERYAFVSFPRLTCDDHGYPARQPSPALPCCALWHPQGERCQTSSGANIQGKGRWLMLRNGADFDTQSSCKYER